MPKELNIEATIDLDIVDSFSKDWSNLPGHANIVVMPKNLKECSKLLQVCYENKVPITISAGKTNLTGSATPFGGIILSTSKSSKRPLRFFTLMSMTNYYTPLVRG